MGAGLVRLGRSLADYVMSRRWHAVHCVLVATILQEGLQ